MTTHDDIAVRSTLPDDLPDLRRVIDGVGLFPSEMLDDMVTPFWGGLSAEFWLTAEMGGQACAMAYAAPERMADRVWNLLLIAVDPDLQGRGVGRSLMAEVERRLAQEGRRLLLVETSGAPEFEATRGFYDRGGYQRQARLIDYYQDGEDKIVFVKRLT